MGEWDDSALRQQVGETPRIRLPRVPLASRHLEQLDAVVASDEGGGRTERNPDVRARPAPDIPTPVLVLLPRAG
jgi:hypothetical protein